MILRENQDRQHLIWETALDRLELDVMRAEQMTARPTTFELEPWDEPHLDGPIPDDLVDSLCRTKSQLGVDAPTGTLDFEEERIDRDVLREREAQLRRQGRTMISTLAVAPDGEVVAYNDLVIPRDDPPNVYQWGTLVRRDHRGHRLGMAVKARGLKELQARLGEELGTTRTRVSTCNAEQNAHMVGINEHLGFRPVEVSPCFLRVDAS